MSILGVVQKLQMSGTATQVVPQLQVAEDE
jgi:hypothetical protein